MTSIRKALRFCSIAAALSPSLGLPAPGEVQESSHIGLSPGPGLPSLEELNITVYDLINPDFTSPRSASSTTTAALTNRDSSSAQFNPKCYHANTSTMGPAMLCQNYLNKIGSQTCLATRDTTWTYMCNATVGSAQAFVRGQPVPGFDEISSPCSDVARGMDWILELCVTARCAGDKCIVGGTNGVWGNGDFVIEIVGNATELSST